MSLRPIAERWKDTKRWDIVSLFWLAGVPLDGEGAIVGGVRSYASKRVDELLGMCRDTERWNLGRHLIVLRGPFTTDHVDALINELESR